MTRMIIVKRVRAKSFKHSKILSKIGSEPNAGRFDEEIS